MHQAQWSPERPLPPPASLASQSHHEKPPEVTCTSRGNPGFPALQGDFLPTREVLRRQAASCFVGEGVRVLAGLREEMLGNRRNLYCGEADSKGGKVK